MIAIHYKTTQIVETQRGFTLIELMIVIAIIGVLAAIAYPNYQRYVIKSKRTDMMSEMHNIASQLESRKLAQGSYSNDLIAGLGGGYPKQGGALYTVAITPNPLTSKWKITAQTINNTQVYGDGDLTLDYQAVKCRDNVCGTGNEWNK